MAKVIAVGGLDRIWSLHPKFKVDPIETPTSLEVNVLQVNISSLQQIDCSRMTDIPSQCWNIF